VGLKVDASMLAQKIFWHIRSDKTLAKVMRMEKGGNLRQEAKMLLSALVVRHKNDHNDLHRHIERT